MKYNIPVLTAMLGLAIAFGGCTAPDSKFADAMSLERLSKQFAPFCVTVEYEVGPFENEQPISRGYRCAGCGGFHGSDIENDIKNGVPQMAPGYLVGKQEVVTPSLGIPARFIRKITIRHASGVSTEAEIAAYCLKEDAIKLQLKSVLPGTEPLAFDGSGKGVVTAAFAVESGHTVITAKPADRSIYRIEELNESFIRPMPSAIWLDKNAKAVAVGMSGEYDADAEMTPPDQWQWITASEMETQKQKAIDAFMKSVVSVRLNFKLLKQENEHRTFYYYSGGRENDISDKSEVFRKGIVIAPETIAIPLALKAEKTATLTGINVADGGSMRTGEFVGNMRDYGVLIVKVPGLNRPVVTISDSVPLELVKTPLIALKVSSLNEDLKVYSTDAKFSDIEYGYKKRMKVELDRRHVELAIDYDGKLNLMTLPDNRPQFARERYSSSDLSLAASELKAMLADYKKALQPNNVPTENQRPLPQPWFGVEVQRVDDTLLKMLKLDLEDNPVMLTEVYPNSPAAKAGLQKDDVLIAYGLTATAQLPLKSEQEYRSRVANEFPWAQYDQIPANYLKQLPAPFPSTEGRFDGDFAELGAGGEVWVTRFRKPADYKVVKVTLESGRRTFATAQRTPNRELGLMVREMTYEVRRYFNLDDNAPGVVVSSVSEAKPAMIAGVKPYELIIAIDGEKVTDLAAFERLLKDKTSEITFTVSRMGQERLVKIKPPKKAAKDKE